MKIRFWGVRGSIPTPGRDTVEVGGNTSCVEVICGETRLIFDAGTGLRVLGLELAKRGPSEMHLFFSHVHWDHIQGFPFFGPAFVPGNTIHMYGGSNVTGTVETALAGQMEMPNFPVLLSQIPAKLKFYTIAENEVLEIAPGVRLTSAAGHHPDGVLSYRVDYQGRSVVYATDTEHEKEPDPRLVSLAQNADVVIFDTMYTPEEYEGTNGGGSKKGWGHSHFVAGVNLMRAANAKKYVLFHHDPDQTDADVATKERRTQALFPNAIAAREGMSLDVE